MLNNYLINLDKDYQQVIWTIGTLDLNQVCKTNSTLDFHQKLHIKLILEAMLISTLIPKSLI